MSENSQSPSKLRMQRRLRKALAEIICSQGKKQKKITVGTLCEYANITRVTFYSYYDSFDDFYNSATEYVIEQFIKQIIEFLFAKRENARAVTRKSSLMICREDLLLLEALFKCRYHSLLNESIFKLLFDSVSSYKNQLFCDVEAEKSDELNFFFIGYLSAMQECFSSYDSKRTSQALIYSFDIAEKIGLKFNKK